MTEYDTLTNPTGSLMPTDFVLANIDASRLRARSRSVPSRGDKFDFVYADDELSPKPTYKYPAAFPCTLCPKRFTRAYNLRSHMRTHTDERPFVCSTCGKSFARQHDRKRHEGLHSGEKKFVCRGDLKEGTFSGCGRRFARVEALGHPFRSEAGQVCIRPLIIEEAQKKARWDGPEHGPQTEASTRVFASDSLVQALPDQHDLPPIVQKQSQLLPAVLLKQHPALATIDWESVPLSGPGETDEIDAGSASKYYE